MVVVSDRVHDLDWVETGRRVMPLRWWQGPSGARQIEAVKDGSGSAGHLSFEINSTIETRFLYEISNQRIYFELAYHGRNGSCRLESGTAEIVRCIHSVRLREEVYQRIQIDLKYERSTRLPPEITYAQLLELDDSPFWAGWKRWFEEWVLFARVSIFGDR